VFIFLVRTFYKFIFRCSSGVVNVYDGSCLHTAEHPTPLKSLKHLTTSVDQAQFNPTGEILAIASKRKKAALRLVRIIDFVCTPVVCYVAYCGKHVCQYV